jgi:hypothetical protein
MLMMFTVLFLFVLLEYIFQCGLFASSLRLDDVETRTSLVIPEIPGCLAGWTA